MYVSYKVSVRASSVAEHYYIYWKQYNWLVLSVCIILHDWQQHSRSYLYPVVPCYLRLRYTHTHTHTPADGFGVWSTPRRACPTPCAAVRHLEMPRRLLTRNIYGCCCSLSVHPGCCLQLLRASLQRLKWWPRAQVRCCCCSKIVAGSPILAAPLHGHQGAAASSAAAVEQNLWCAPTPASTPSVLRLLYVWCE